MEPVRAKTVNVIHTVTGVTAFKCMTFSLGQQWLFTVIASYPLLVGDIPAYDFFWCGHAGQQLHNIFKRISHTCMLS